jgi:effector-binding domain-containing protein
MKILSTTKAIEVAENKTLKLKNVLSKEIGFGDDAETRKAAYMFESYIKSRGFDPYGPTVVRASVTYENGRPVQRKEMMVQLRHVPDRIESPYSFTELLRAENCLMARYRGDAQSLQMAYGKLQVYAFENGIDLKGDSFTIVVEQNDSGILADVFAETVK